MLSDPRESRLIWPCSRSICCSTCLILAALIRCKPPTSMARAMSSIEAEAMASQLSKLALREAKALPEFASEVFCDSMVPISSSIGSVFARHSLGPYSCSRSSMTSSIATSSKIPCRQPLMQRRLLRASICRSLCEWDNISVFKTGNEYDSSRKDTS
jgi:hypothetical protein